MKKKDRQNPKNYNLKPFSNVQSRTTYGFKYQEKICTKE